MKTKTTIKFIRQSYDNIFRCGYCDLQDIMKYREPTFYNFGVYGWNCDIYTDYARDIAITTGYRNMTGKCIPSELIKKYSKIAKDIAENTKGAKFDEIMEALDQNRQKFFDELLNI